MEGESKRRVCWRKVELKSRDVKDEQTPPMFVIFGVLYFLFHRRD